MEHDDRSSMFVDHAKSLLTAAGLVGAEVVSFSAESNAFGSAEAVFRLGPILLRFTRDRGQEFIDLGSTVEPTVFHQCDDVDVAMGWRTLNEILVKQEPEALPSVLARLNTHLDSLSDALSVERERLTRARLERAARERGKAFTDRLRGGH